MQTMPSTTHHSILEGTPRAVSSNLPPAKAPSRLLRPRSMQVGVDLVAFTTSFFLYQWLRVILFGDEVRAFSVTENLMASGIM